MHNCIFSLLSILLIVSFLNLNSWYLKRPLEDLHQLEVNSVGIQQVEGFWRTDTKTSLEIAQPGNGSIEGYWEVFHGQSSSKEAGGLKRLIYGDSFTHKNSTSRSQLSGQSKYYFFQRGKVLFFNWTWDWFWRETRSEHSDSNSKETRNEHRNNKYLTLHF